MTDPRLPDDVPADPSPARRQPTVGRRALLGGAAAAAATLGVPAPALASPRPDSGPDRFRRGRPLLIRNATVVSMDPGLGVMPSTDVLVVGNKIAAVGRRLSSPDSAAVIDAKGALLTPGFVDTHRHMWQSSMRGLGAEWTLTNYFDYITLAAPRYRPEDTYAGDYLGMVEAVADGVTTVLDWSQGSRTPAHADAAVDALTDVGGRARWAYATLDADPAYVVNGEVARIRESRFSSRSQLVTMQLALDIRPDQPNMAAAYRYAVENDLPVSQHVGIFGFSEDAPISWLVDQGFLRPTSNLVHAGALSDDSYRKIADAGAHLSLSAESELNAGQGYPPTARARSFGIPISLSLDTVVWWSGDMFSIMRATLNADRGLAHLQSHARGEVRPFNDLRTADVLRYATMGGAEALQMGDQIGSITPGKLADLVLMRRDTPAMTPINNPVAHLVFQAGRGDIDTVIVNGKVMKHKGELVGLNLDRARRLAERSRDYIRATVGEKVWQGFLDPRP